MEFINSPWPWYVVGPLIALIFFSLTFFGKNFGMSANLRTVCAISGGKKVSNFFDFDWKNQKWNLFVLFGAVLGGFISSTFLMPEGIEMSETLTNSLNEMGITDTQNTMVPTEIFGTKGLSLKTLGFLLFGGFFVGFGARYAGGCSSGHAISGLSDLQIPSLIAVIGFFIGGLIMTWFILPAIL